MDGVGNSETTSKTRLSRSKINSIKRQKKNEAFSKNNGDKMTNSIPSQKADHVGSSQNKKSYASSLNGDRDSKVEKQVTTVKGNTLSKVPLTPSLITPALVLDDSCVSVRDLSRHVIGRVKDLIYIPNLRSFLTKEGFSDVKLTYLVAAIYDFVSDERVVWVDIEGKRLCIKTKHADNILEKFKVIFKGKVYMARAKELFTWTPIFLDHKGSEYISDDESLHGAKNNSEKVVEQQSEDPFCIYDVLNKKPKGVAQDSDSSLSHPPGFTPEVSRQENDRRGVDLNTEIDKVNSPLVHTKVMNNSQKVHKNVTSNGESAFNYSHNAHNGGSILEVLDDMIRVGKSMGYAMEGCMRTLNTSLGHKESTSFPNEYSLIKYSSSWLQDEKGVDQVADMDRSVSRDEIRVAVWNCGENKSPGPDGSFILNELLAWCKRKKKQAMIFKVDFTKAYDSVHWDYLLDVLKAFGFGPNWCKWIRGTFSSAMASILVNGSPTSELPFLATSDGLFKGIQIQGSMAISHLFYVDDAVLWGNGVIVGDSMSWKLAWADTVQKLHSWLSKWKVKTLSIGGRLTLLKSILGASPLYNMSIYKVPKGVMKEMEAIRCKFFSGADPAERKITWVSWDKVLASKKNGGLGVSSFHALNRALLLKWVWHFLSQDGFLWYRIIQALYGASFELHPVNQSSIWCSILREMQVLISKGFDFVSHCKKCVGDNHNTRFWYDSWVFDQPLHVRFPRLFALEMDKVPTVASKLGSSSVDASFRRSVRDGVERQQWDDLISVLDDIFLPSAADATRWVKYIPIKINVFAWRAQLDRLPTRSNLVRRGVVLDSSLCPLCGLVPEDIHHVLFRCDTAKLVFHRICRWWDLDWHDLLSFSDWNAWFSAIRLLSRIKLILEGVFYVAWWHLWVYRNQSIFAATPPRRSVIFDDIVSCSFTCTPRENLNLASMAGGDDTTQPKTIVANEKPYGINNIKTYIPLVLDLNELNYDSWSKLFTLHCKSFRVLDIIQRTYSSATHNAEE
uniref:RNA-directed DNA polymerase, eukaryota n=1 Tax=Tanacetum cinerariifolium TaxID=118510 RepID=A0A6L2J0M4_TANCI|nr:RNA-directed DNA polymerase, eukaryota [Tanacetum cinerariifolium]